MTDTDELFRLEHNRQKRALYAAMTPEQKAQRLAKKRQRRQELKRNDPEKYEQIKAAERERYHKYRARLTDEQLQKIRLKKNKQNRSRYAQMTDQDRAEAREYGRQYYIDKMACMTPDELTAYRADRAKYKREWANRTPEQRERLREYQRQYRANMTPEQRERVRQKRRAQYLKKKQGKNNER